MGKEGQSPKLRNVLIDISANVAFTDGGDSVTKIIAEIMGQSIPEIVLGNVCRYCGPELTRAAKKELQGKVLNRILKHPNLDVTAPYNKDYRGALGIPKRYNKSKIKNYFKKALTIQVSACGYGSKTIASSAIIAGGDVAGSLRAARRASSAQSISVYIKRLVQEAYKATSFRTGGRKRVGKRNWLIEANTGKPKNNGWGVFPGPGESLEKLDRRRRSDVQTNDSSQPNFDRYSRSGTHIMVRGRQYDPNDWRPEPDVSNVIEKIMIANLPKVLKAAEKAVPGCLRRIKAKMQKDAQRIANKRLAKVNKLAIQIKGGRGGQAEKVLKSTAENTGSLANLAVSGETTEGLNVQIAEQVVAKGLSLLKKIDFDVSAVRNLILSQTQQVQGNALSYEAALAAVKDQLQQALPNLAQFEKSLRGKK